MNMQNLAREVKKLEDGKSREWISKLEAMGGDHIQVIDNMSSFNLDVPPMAEHDKEIPKVEVREFDRPTLEEAQAAVGGYIEVLEIGFAQLVVDEEGRITSKVFNPVASLLARRIIVGDVMVLFGAARMD